MKQTIRPELAIASAHAKFLEYQGCVIKSVRCTPAMTYILIDEPPEGAIDGAETHPAHGVVQLDCSCIVEWQRKFPQSGGTA